LARVSQHQLKLNGDYQRWDVKLKKKCCYKLQPRKCLDLNVANLIISISKNGEKTSNFHKFFMFLSFSKTILQVVKFFHKKYSHEYIVVRVATFCQFTPLIELNVFEFLK
jgi:hypothetical protein